MGFKWLDKTDWPEPLDEADIERGIRYQPIAMPATMDEIIQRRHGTDEDPEGRFQ